MKLRKDKGVRDKGGLYRGTAREKSLERTREIIVRICGEWIRHMRGK